MNTFIDRQKNEDRMWDKHKELIKNTLTKNSKDAILERVTGILDYDCAIDAVIKLSELGIYQVRFISLRMLNNNYNHFTFRIPSTKAPKELFKLLSPYNPTPYYHLQITEGNSGLQIAVLDLHKLSIYIKENPSFWETIQRYIKVGKRNDYYNIPMSKFERFMIIKHINTT
jgi:hypothetical protein